MNPSRPAWLLATLLLVPGCHGPSPAPPAPTRTPRAAGGYAPAPIDAPGVQAAAAFAIRAQAETLKPDADGTRPRLELVAIRGAEQQVVAGMNYRLQLGLTIDGKPRTAEAVVWWQAWRTPDPYRLTAWTWR